MCAHPQHSRASGYTLTELLVVMTIVAILLGIGAPSYRSVTTSSRVSTEVNALLGDMQFARSEALKEGLPVTVCISADGATCSGSTAWQSGWIVFADANGNAAVDGSETLLRVQKAFTGGDGFQADNNLNAITFNRDGFALNLPNGGVLLSLHDPTGNSVFTRCLSVTLTGMMTTQTHTASPATCT